MDITNSGYHSMSNTTTYSSRSSASRFRRSSKQPYVQPDPSPIEISFWQAAKPLIPELEKEQWIGPYRVDFLIPSKKLVIELYGYQWHNTKEKITKDMQRERQLQRRGYSVVAFTGSEVFKNPRACAQETMELAARLPVSQIASQSNVPTVQLNQPPLSSQQPIYAAEQVDIESTRTARRSQKKSRLFGLQSRQLGIVIGMLIFDFIIIGAGLALAFS